MGEMGAVGEKNKYRLRELNLEGGEPGHDCIVRAHTGEDPIER